MTKHLVIPAVIIAIAIGLFTCKGTSTEGDTSNAPSFSYHYSKCVISREMPPYYSSLDSLFVYSFTDSLVIDFSVMANCCPDSNRFIVSQTTGSDTIVISVLDTAEQICRCTCPYMIHTEFADLPNDHYVVRCNLTVLQSSGITNLIHLADVYRQE